MLTSYILHRNDARPEADAAWLLGIDTSADRAGIALWNGQEMHECTWPAPRAQTTEVLPRIQRLLATVGAATDDLVAVAVAIGPGTFTGLRVGLSLAKGLAMAHGLPIIGVPTLAATALPWLEAGLPVIAVLPAGRGRLVWQRFRPDALESDEAGSPVNGTPGELLDALSGADVRLVAGELPDTLRQALEPSSVPVVASAGLASRVGAIALLGRQQLLLGEHDDLVTLEPIYVHGTPKAKGPVRDGRP